MVEVSTVSYTHLDVYKRQPECFLDMCRVGRFPEKPATERDRIPDRFEGVGGEFLGNESNERTRGAVVAHDVMAINGNRSGTRIDDPADNADQCRFAGTIRAK